MGITANIPATEKDNIKAIFMGSDDISCTFLSALIHAPDIDVVAVVTQPDKERGRHLKVISTLVKDLALMHCIPVLTPEKVNTDDSIKTLQSYNPDTIIVMAYGQFLKQAILDMPRLGCINMHVSVLPELRGAAPIQHAIMRGYSETGVTGMMMDIGMDTGDILEIIQTSITEEDTTESLQFRLASSGSDLMLKIIRDLNRGAARRIPQDHLKATFAPKINKADSLIKWFEPALQICRKIRALNPKPICYTFMPNIADHANSLLPGPLIKVKNATVEPLPGDLTCIPQPGTIICMKPVPLIAAGDGMCVKLLEVLPEGRKGYMSGFDFANGYINKIKIGDQLYPGNI